MFRTFLLATRHTGRHASFEQVIDRVAGLYQARHVVAMVESPDDLARASDRPAAAVESAADSSAVASRGSIQSVVLAGEFVAAVCDRGHEADVIVVWHASLTGADGEPSAEEMSRFVRQAPRPVWLGREPVRFPEHIVVGYDGSAHSGRALHMGANLAETLGARLTVLHVDEAHDAVAQELILARAAGYCEAYRITLERVGVQGTAATSIGDYAASCQCDLLVLGAAGVGYLRGLLFGSVAGQLIATAPCSVLVAK